MKFSRATWTKVTVEQAGPVRAAVRVEGVHARTDPARFLAAVHRAALF